MATKSGEIRRLIERADGVQRTAAPRRGGSGPAAPDANLLSFVRLSLDDPEAARLVQRAAARLAPSRPLDVTAATVLEEAMALTGAGLGNVQLVEPTTHELRIVASRGFGREFLDHFAVVADDTSACGRAAAEHRQTVIADVDADAGFAAHRGVAAASKFRAVQSTPLIDADGNLVGMVSTHFARPGAPTARQLEMTRLYGLVAGEALARSLAGRPAHRVAGQDGQDGQDGKDSQGGQDGQDGGDPAGRGRPPAPQQTDVLDLADTIVRALLSAGLSLAGAQSLMRDGAASAHVAAAIDELDQALDGIRSAVLDLHSAG